MTETMRKYAMTMIGPGDWLLPSNDAEMIWRISRYDDPEMTGQTTGWQLHNMPLLSFQRLLDRNWEDPTDWAHWDYDSGGYRTRSEAVDAVNGIGGP